MTTSFYGSHMINCAGNGGMICLNDPGMRRRAMLLRSCGLSSSDPEWPGADSAENRFHMRLEGFAYDRTFVLKASERER